MIDFIGSQNKKDLVGVEVGVQRAQNAVSILKKLDIKKLYLVDSYDTEIDENAEEIKAIAFKNMKKHKNIEFIIADSVEASASIPEQVDFVYIDGDHRFDYVMQDVIEWSKKVRPGGMVSGHDYYRFRNAGVVPAVDVYTHVHGIHEWFLTDEKEASFFWVKA